MPNLHLSRSLTLLWLTFYMLQETWYSDFLAGKHLCILAMHLCIKGLHSLSMALDVHGDWLVRAARHRARTSKLHAKQLSANFETICTRPWPLHKAVFDPSTK